MAFDLGSLAGGALSGIGSALSGIGWKKKLKKSYDLQQKYHDYTAESNYQYGEMAADNAHQRSLELQQNQFENASLSNQVAEAKEAGLSPSIFSNISGGSGGGGGGGAQGGGARGIQPMDIAALQQVENERRSIGIDAGRAAAEAALQYAESKKIKAETENLQEQTSTSKELTPVQKALMQEQGVAQWIENLQNKFKSEFGSEGLGGETQYHEWDNRFGTYTILKDSYINQELATQIAEKTANIEFQNEKQKQGWAELLNAARTNDIEEIKAKAVKLATEWTTGEYTNWKTWAGIATDAIGNISDILGSTLPKTTIRKIQK